VLLAAAVFALLISNSAWGPAYESWWHTPVAIRIGALGFEEDLRFLINDGLMTVFFFVVGLEIRRELSHGELRQLRRATLPFAAALGGMLVPAALFFTLNSGRAGEHGWGVPMATDIAFAVGVFALLGTRVPRSLKVLLLALAIIDDIGAIVVIALFYSGSFHLNGLLLVGLGVVGVLVLKGLGARSPWTYVAPAAVIWAGLHAAGVHPTLAGVAVALMTPTRAWFGREGFLARASQSLAHMEEQDDFQAPELWSHLDALNQARREAVAPTDRLLRRLHGPVAFGIMPLFALANAGVRFDFGHFSPDALRVFSGAFFGLLIGKPLGVVAFCFLAVRSKVAALPRGANFVDVLLVGLLAGIGFTMALFIGQLAFSEHLLLEAAKLGVLCGSATAALVSFLFGLWLLTRRAKRSSLVAAPARDAAQSSTPT
jgi:NhaA family Na+:H+ antiporter